MAMPMKVLQAADMGMGFGVRDALGLARNVATPTQVTVFGELVHNPVVLETLRGRGMTVLAETGRGEIPASPTVLITAHGISDRQRARLLEEGKVLIDTTCPLVQRVHEAARAWERGVPAWHVEGAGELRSEWFRGIKTVGLTAGTSTLADTIAAVRAELEHIARVLETREAA